MLLQAENKVEGLESEASPPSPDLEPAMGATQRPVFIGILKDLADPISKQDWSQLTKDVEVSPEFSQQPVCIFHQGPRCRFFVTLEKLCLQVAQLISVMLLL
ncbi:hypothetical protein H8959_004502 [Pygathrix nigripes]